MFDNLVEKLKANPKRIVYTEGTDARILESAARLKKDGFLTPVLLGNVEDGKAAAAKWGPGSTAGRAAWPISASNTPTGRGPLPPATPFEQTITGKTTPTRPASRSATSRMMLDGVTMTAAQAPSSTSSCEEEAAMRSDSTTSLR